MGEICKQEDCKAGCICAHSRPLPGQYEGEFDRIERLKREDERRQAISPSTEDWEAQVDDFATDLIRKFGLMSAAYLNEPYEELGRVDAKLLKDWLRIKKQEWETNALFNSSKTTEHVMNLGRESLKAELIEKVGKLDIGECDCGRTVCDRRGYITGVRNAIALIKEI